MAAEIRVVGLQAIIDAMEAKAPGAIQRSVGGRLIDIVNEARSEWPVKTGRSANALHIRAARRADGMFVWIIEDRMPYAGAVFPKGEDRSQTCAETLVFEPVAEALDGMLEDFGTELAHA